MLQSTNWRALVKGDPDRSLVSALSMKYQHKGEDNFIPKRHRNRNLLPIPLFGWIFFDFAPFLNKKLPERWIKLRACYPQTKLEQNDTEAIEIIHMSEYDGYIIPLR